MYGASRADTSGTVLSVQIDKSHATAMRQCKQSIEAAVISASPLPPPPDPRLFERNLVWYSSRKMINAEEQNAEARSVVRNRSRSRR